MSSSVRSAAAEAGDNPVVEKGARLGFAASGLLHLLLAWVALQVAWTGSGAQADQGGALATLSGNPVGSVLLWLTVVGFALLAIWQVTEAIVRTDTGTRLKSAGRAVVHVALAWTAFTVVQGSGSGSSDPGSSLTSQMMQSPAGRVAIAVAGLAVVAVGGYHVVKGWTKSFLRDLREHPGTWTVRAGRAGYVAKGVALVVVGSLLTSAAATSSADQAQGLDAALHTIVGLPLGKALLTLVALGFAAYGAYAFVRARFGRV